MWAYLKGELIRVAFKSSPERDKNSLTAFYRFPNKTDLCSTQYKRFCTCQLVPTRVRGMMTARELTQSLHLQTWFLCGGLFGGMGTSLSTGSHPILCSKKS